MHTDKQIHQLFQACPPWIDLLCGRPPVGPASYESVELKALSRTMDGLLVPEDASAPLTVVEVQFQSRADIYNRTITEMALVQASHDYRDIQGVIFFATESLDPRQRPWTNLIQAVYLEPALNELRQEHQEHPLLAVFAPLLEKEEELERTAAQHYSRLQKTDQAVRHALLEVFESWLLERFSTLSRKEIRMILNLPDLKDTVCGRELLDEGIERGIEQGIEKGIEEGIERGIDRVTLLLLERRCGQVLSDEQRARVEALTVAQAESLALALLEFQSLDDLERWLKNA